MSEISRRGFHSRVLATVASSAWLSGVACNGEGDSNSLADAPGVQLADKDRPAVVDGVASGDVGSDGIGVVWARTDRPSRMIVEWSTTDSFQDAQRVAGDTAIPETGLTAQTVLTSLPAGQTIVYRVGFVDLGNPKAKSRPVMGRFRTPNQLKMKDVKFAWGGDMVGQGYGIDVSRGGLGIFDAIRKVEPDFFIHSGDHIYADDPIWPELDLPDGTKWRNVLFKGTGKVAETQDEFRARFRYNRLDEAVRRFGAEVPVLAQWDDHEVMNNWYPGKILDDKRYQVKEVDLLATRARQAFFEHMPLRAVTANPRRIYRSVRQGAHLEVFLLDQRSYRGRNSTNKQAEDSLATAFLGPEQLRWLTEGLKQSKATWKVIASDTPLGLNVIDGTEGADPAGFHFENQSNGDSGAPIGRERELARLLSDLKQAQVKNIVWLTADVHYAAAHHYDPSRATFTDFDPFWEFVAGPLHAGTFNPVGLDATFGPEVRFNSIPPGMKPNQPPSAGLQFFGQVAVSGKTRAMTVSLHNRTGEQIYDVTLPSRMA